MTDRATDEPVLNVDGLETAFDIGGEYYAAVNDVSFSVGPGEIFGIVGESGSGKSVTARSVLRLIGEGGRMDARELTYRGEDLLGKSEREMQSIRGREISMVFQDPMSSLNPAMTVGEQVAEVVRHHDPDVGESTGFFSELRRKYVTGTAESSDSWQRAVELLETVGIPDAAERAREHPHQLSGGMRQRVVIAQALAGNPSLVLADEPTTALDVSIEAQILNELRRLKETHDISVVLITHDLGVVREICDRVAVMYCGEIMETAPVEELFEDPKHPYTEGLVRSIPRLGDDESALSPIRGTVPDLEARPTGCPFKTRCDYRFEDCDAPLPDVDVTESHRVRCHLYKDSTTETLEGVQ